MKHSIHRVVLAFVLITLVHSNLYAAEANDPGTVAANATGASAPSSSAPVAEKAAQQSDEEADHKKEKKFRLSGKLEMKGEQSGDEAQKIDKSYDGILFTTQGATPFKARDEDVLELLKSNDGKTVTLEGRVKEPEGEDKWLLVQRIVERAQPAMGMRNPRGI